MMLAAQERPQKYILERAMLLPSLTLGFFAFQREVQTERAVILLPIEAPDAVLDVDKTFATRRVHKCAKLLGCAVITRRELAHRLNAVQWEPTQIREHALDELSPTRHSGHSTKHRTESQGDGPSSIPSFVPPAVAVL